MPNSVNARKRHRQSLVRRDRNRNTRSRVRSSIRKFETILKAGNKEAASTQFQQLTKLLDTATGKKVYHPNTSARKKSRLHKRLAALA